MLTTEIQATMTDLSFKDTLNALSDAAFADVDEPEMTDEEVSDYFGMDGVENGEEVALAPPPSFDDTLTDVEGISAPPPAAPNPEVTVATTAQTDAIPQADRVTVGGYLFMPANLPGGTTQPVTNLNNIKLDNTLKGTLGNKATLVNGTLTTLLKVTTSDGRNLVIKATLTAQDFAAAVPNNGDTYTLKGTMKFGGAEVGLFKITNNNGTLEITDLRP